MSREAEEAFAQAEKAANKKSFFGKPNPDYDVAVPLYEQAANLFRNAKDYNRAVESLLKGAECHRILHSMFLAAKAIETAASLTLQHLKSPERASELYHQSSGYFLAQGSPDRAGELMENLLGSFFPGDSID